MPLIPDNKPARFCWVDLATADASLAADFYRGLCGWQATTQRANGGEIQHFTAGGETVASMYQLDARQIVAGAPSHWTPYIGVANIDKAAEKAMALGGQVIVRPFGVDGMARVSLISDSVGALLGLWEIVK